MRNLIYGLAVRAERSCCGVKSSYSSGAGVLIELGCKILGALCNERSEYADEREQLLCNKGDGVVGVNALGEHLRKSVLGNAQSGEKDIFNTVE